MCHNFLSHRNEFWWVWCKCYLGDFLKLCSWKHFFFLNRMSTQIVHFLPRSFREESTSEFILGCWQNPVPSNGRADVSVFLITINQGLLSASESHLHFFSYGPLHLWSWQWRISLITSHSCLESFLFPLSLTSRSRFQGLVCYGETFLESIVPHTSLIMEVKSILLIGLRIMQSISQGAGVLGTILKFYLRQFGYQGKILEKIF